MRGEFHSFQTWRRRKVLGDPRLEIRLTGCPDFQWILEIRLTDPAVPISNTTALTVHSRWSGIGERGPLQYQFPVAATALAAASAHSYIDSELSRSKQLGPYGDAARQVRPTRPRSRAWASQTSEPALWTCLSCLSRERALSASAVLAR